MSEKQADDNGRAAEVLGRVVDAPTLFLFWCPGCKCAHHLETKPGRWAWNSDMAKPTATPSLLVRVRDNERCHLLMLSGQLQFLGDCTHELAGKTVDMEPWEDVNEGDVAP